MMYKDQNLVYTEYKKGSSTFTVKKWKTKMNTPASNNKAVNEALIMDKFGAAAKVENSLPQQEILFEDEMCRAVRADKPVAKTHILVSAKKDGLKSLSQATEKDAAMLGHLMRVVAKVAKEQGLQDGYRTVINNGKAGC